MTRRVSRQGNKNQRPNSYAGRALKVWMLAEFGDGITVPCSFDCGRRLFYSEITKDRHPVPGRKGGRYVKGNVRPACMSCNAREGARQAALERAIALAKREVRNARRRLLYALRKKGEVIYMAESYEIDPAWSSTTGQEILDNIIRVTEELRSFDPKNIDFRFSVAVEPDRAYFLRREVTQMPKHSVVLNPVHEEAVEAWLETL